jgi:multimeric flavodoxin WrbA
MKTLVLYYSYSSHTRQYAEKFAAENNAELLEITDLRRPGKLSAYLKGCPAAIKGKAWEIAPVYPEWPLYEHVVIFSPVWAGNPPPAVNAVLERLPRGKTVSVKMVSAGGSSKCRARIAALLEEKGCTLDELQNIKAG